MTAAAAAAPGVLPPLAVAVLLGRPARGGDRAARGCRRQIAGTAGPTPVRLGLDVGAAGSGADAAATADPAGGPAGWPRRRPRRARPGAERRHAAADRAPAADRVRRCGSGCPTPTATHRWRSARRRWPGLDTGGRGGRRHAARRSTFDGRPRVIVPAGRDLLSDPVPVAAEAGRALAVSLHLPAAPAGRHRAPGGPADLLPVRPRRLHRRPGRRPVRPADQSWPVLTGVDVLLPRPVNAVVAVGDSITDGVGSPADADARWTDALARRLAAAGGPATMAVLNAGLSGNQLLADDPRRGRRVPARPASIGTCRGRRGDRRGAAHRHERHRRRPGRRRDHRRAAAVRRAGQGGRAAGVPDHDHAVAQRGARHPDRRGHPERGERLDPRARAGSTPTGCSTSPPRWPTGRPEPAGRRPRLGRRAAPLGGRLPGAGRRRRPGRAHRQPVPGRRARRHPVLLVSAATR